MKNSKNLLSVSGLQNVRVLFAMLVCAIVFFGCAPEESNFPDCKDCKGHKDSNVGSEITPRPNGDKGYFDGKFAVICTENGNTVGQPTYHQVNPNAEITVSSKEWWLERDFTTEEASSPKASSPVKGEITSDNGIEKTPFTMNWTYAQKDYYSKESFVVGAMYEYLKKLTKDCNEKEITLESGIVSAKIQAYKTIQTGEPFMKDGKKWTPATREITVTFSHNKTNSATQMNYTMDLVVVVKMNIMGEVTPDPEVKWVDSVEKLFDINCNAKTLNWWFELISCHCTDASKKTLLIKNDNLPYVFEVTGKSTIEDFIRENGNISFVIDPSRTNIGTPRVIETRTINDSIKMEVSEVIYTVAYIGSPVFTITLKYSSKYIYFSSKTNIKVEREVSVPSIENLTPSVSEITGNSTYNKYQVTFNQIFKYAQKCELPNDIKGIMLEKKIEVPGDSVTTWESKNRVCHTDATTLATMTKVQTPSKGGSAKRTPYEIELGHVVVVPALQNVTVSDFAYSITGKTHNPATFSGSWSTPDANGISLGKYSGSYVVTTSFGTVTFPFFYFDAKIGTENFTQMGYEVEWLGVDESKISDNQMKLTFKIRVKWNTKGKAVCSQDYSAFVYLNKSADEVDRYEWRESSIDCGNASVKRFSIYKSGNEVEVGNYPSSWRYNANYTASAASNVSNFTLSNVSYGSNGNFSNVTSWTSGTGIQKGSKSASYTIGYSIGGASKSMTLALSTEDLRVWLDANTIYTFPTVVSYEISNTSLTVSNTTATSANVVFNGTMTVKLSNGKSCSKAISASQSYTKTADETWTWLWKEMARSCGSATAKLYKNGSVSGEAFVKNGSLNLPQGANNNYNQSATEINSWNNNSVSVTSSNVNSASGASWSNNTQKWSGSVSFSTSLGVTVTDGFYYTEGRFTATETTVVGNAPTVTGVVIESSNASLVNSSNTASGYEVKKVVVNYTLRLTYSDGTSCTISGTANADAKVKKADPIHNFGKAIGSITFGQTAAMSGEVTIGFYSENGVNLGIIAHVAGKEVGRWTASEVDMEKVNTVVKHMGTGAWTPAYTQTMNNTVYWFSALKGANPGLAIHSLMWNQMTAEGFFKGTDTSSYTYDVKADGIYTTVFYEMTQGNKKVSKQYTDKLPLKFN